MRFKTGDLITKIGDHPIVWRVEGTRTTSAGLSCDVKSTTSTAQGFLVCSWVDEQFEQVDR